MIFFSFILLLSTSGGGGGGCLQGCDATGAAVIKCFHNISAISSNRISMYFQLYFLEEVKVFTRCKMCNDFKQHLFAA